MKVAILADIHGNTMALENVLDDAESIQEVSAIPSRRTCVPPTQFWKQSRKDTPSITGVSIMTGRQ